VTCRSRDAAKRVRLRVEANGICRTDWHLDGDWTWVGVALPLPHVMGHDSAASSRRSVRGHALEEGRRVLVPFSSGCGTCEWCRSGHHNVCDAFLTPGVVYWGGYGRYVGVPYADVNLVELPENVGSPTPRHGLSLHDVVPRDRRSGAGQSRRVGAVHGCGGVGLSAVQIATALGANVIAVDVADDKLAFAKELGAVATVNATKDDPASAIASITKGGAQVSVDALGVAATCRNSIMSLRKRAHLQSASPAPPRRARSRPHRHHGAEGAELHLLPRHAGAALRRDARHVEKGRLAPASSCTSASSSRK